MNAVLDELKLKLASRPDYITLSGSGEPTLHSRLGEIIEHIQAMTAVPVAVLTNGSLLWQKEVREELALADVVLPSLDAPDPDRFELINRPHPDITFDRLLDGLQALRREFAGQYWLEVMLLDGYTTLPPQIRKLAKYARRIRPDKVQLNTAVRPPAEEYAMAVPPQRLAEITEEFGLNAEVVAEHRPWRKTLESRASEESLLALLCRRPCTLVDIAQGLSLKPVEVAKLLAGLQSKGKVLREQRATRHYYRAAVGSPRRKSCDAKSQGEPPHPVAP